MKFICDGKAEFSVSLLQSSVSHDPSEILLIYWFGAQLSIITHLLLMVSAENVLLVEIFNNIINVLTVTFDQFNASSMN